MLLDLLVFFIIMEIKLTVCHIVNWGEECKYTEECGDHRLVCERLTDENATRKLCICDRFHEWNGTTVGCVQKYSASEILQMTKEKYNVSGVWTYTERIEYESNLIFLVQVIAGALVLIIGFTCAISVCIYCYHMWKKDLALEDIINKMELQKQEQSQHGASPSS